jgi:16S rRNA (cytidine1402-2'-O)-methyltransferase
VAGLILSGLPSGRFCFEGFLAVNKKSRREHLNAIANEARTMIFYEAPHKLLYTLRDLLEALGDRRISISRELTKLHEQTLRTTLSGAIEHFTVHAPKGEFVLTVEGAREEKPKADAEEALRLARAYMKKGLSAKDAARQASAETGASKNALYAALHSFSEE